MSNPKPTTMGVTTGNGDDHDRKAVHHGAKKQIKHQQQDQDNDRRNVKITDRRALPLRAPRRD